MPTSLPVQTQDEIQPRAGGPELSPFGGASAGDSAQDMTELEIFGIDRCRCLFPLFPKAREGGEQDLSRKNSDVPRVPLVPRTNCEARHLGHRSCAPAGLSSVPLPTTSGDSDRAGRSAREKIGRAHV